jgi:hypothetical protein
LQVLEELSPGSGVRAVPSTEQIRPQEQQADTGDNVVLDHLLYHENPEVGINPMEFIPEDPILRPNEYRPNFGDMFGDDS